MDKITNFITGKKNKKKEENNNPGDHRSTLIKANNKAPKIS